MIPLRKPLTRKLLTRPAAHGYRAQLIMTLEPNGTLHLREARSRRPPIRLDLALLYAKARLAEARASLAPRQSKGPGRTASRRARPRR